MVDATQVQIRRGTQTNCEGMVPVEGEVICDLTNDTLRVGDGSKAGGHLMPNVARMQSGQYMFATAGGTANAITVDLAPAVEFLTVGMEFRFLAVANNTGAVTVSLNGLAAVGLRKIQSGTASVLISGDISSGVIYNVVYDGSYLILVGGVGSVGSNEIEDGAVTPQKLDRTYVQIYQGTSPSATSFPIGHIVLASQSGGTPPSINGTPQAGTPLRVQGSGYAMSNSGTLLAGTWRCRGIVSGAYLMQRVS